MCDQLSEAQQARPSERCRRSNASSWATGESSSALVLELAAPRPADTRPPPPGAPRRALANAEARAWLRRPSPTLPPSFALSLSPSLRLSFSLSLARALVRPPADSLPLTLGLVLPSVDRFSATPNLDSLAYGPAPRLNFQLLIHGRGERAALEYDTFLHILCDTLELLSFSLQSWRSFFFFLLSLPGLHVCRRSSFA